MKTFSLTMFGRLTLAFSLLCAPALLVEEAGAAARINKVEHKAASDGEEVVLNFDAAVKPKVSTIGGAQPRLILDFEGAEPRGGVGNLTPKSSVVKGVRMGVHREDGLKTRLVVDLKSDQDLLNSSVRVDERTKQVIVSVPGGARAATSASPATAPVRNATAAIPAAAGEQGGPSAAPALPPSSRVVAASSSTRSTPLLAAAAIVPEAAAATRTEERTPGAASRRTPARTASADEAAPAVETPTIAAAPTVPAPAVAAPTVPTPAVATPAVAAAPAAEEEKPKSRWERRRLARQKKKQEAEERKAREQAAKRAAAEAPSATGTAAPAAGALVNNVAGDAVAPEPDPSTPYLSAIEYDPDSPRGELVQFRLNGFYPPVLRSIESGTPQVICEFENLAVAPALQGPLKYSGRLVKGIRLDKPAGGGKVRVFVELAPGKHYDLQQVFFKEDNFFVLMVNTFKR